MRSPGMVSGLRAVRSYSHPPHPHNKKAPIAAACVAYLQRVRWYGRPKSRRHQALGFHHPLRCKLAAAAIETQWLIGAQTARTPQAHFEAEMSCHAVWVFEPTAGATGQRCCLPAIEDKARQVWKTWYGWDQSVLGAYIIVAQLVQFTRAMACQHIATR